MTKSNSVYVTRPTLPPLEEFIPYLTEIWKSNIVTNGGPFHQQLEQALCDYLEVNYISLFNNGTIALITALQALELKGEVITTPYSFVATANSLLWNGIQPVFVDIDPISLNLDPSRIEEAITDKTAAIMPVHCYGRPCDLEQIQKIAQKYNLKVIYDAAHAFGVRNQSGSILRSGDLSVLSFHATKVFNTFEGGAIVCHDIGTKKHIDQLKNFGFVDEVTIVAAGINGKMSEVNSAFGLLQLKCLDLAILKRKKIDEIYRAALRDIRGIDCIQLITDVINNYSYFPILVGPDYSISRDRLYEKLKEHGVYARRYFYPLISNLSMYKEFTSSSQSNLPIANDIAQKILCLPIYPDLELVDQEKIISLIRKFA
ncbi:DegT/DnrJ/EryC1/StrS aminotransferase family protein [Polynucleobacter sp. MG-6-Vaara-E2]|uniref:DegT/DnrJ/EryC1/StrS family aminotransferase n=1 Tax=Polynucleobacter sp. MG-6-Vaara-E2 TaxID=2576932 RepID=UPI001BFD71F4|nr:DegT/DnrJ/EryC1/StrS family aminotransferase [Polynucleobacter sp. MG-6-Vaara-E2]QWD96900.1 DegT/DnrJ/EryC1/StrS family aminotransferase [Polynucleobacter sp. MG-6-Vaara-E2]